MIRYMPDFSKISMPGKVVGAAGERNKWKHFYGPASKAIFNA